MDSKHQMVKIPMESQSAGAATAEQDTKNYPVPLDLFCYMNQAYKEKIKDIERDNGVQIKAQVMVSIEVDQRARTDLSKACREFTDLVLSCLSDYDSHTLPLSNADPANWTATLKTLQREEAKVVLTACSEAYTVCGPRESLAALTKSLTKPKDTPGKANIFPSASKSFTKPQDTRGNYDISPSTYAWGSSGVSLLKLMKTPGNVSSAGAASMGGGATAGGATGENSDDHCPICMDAFNNRQKLECGHEFCEKCLNLSVASLGPTCPVCKHVFGTMEGDQPEGYMSWKNSPYSIPGFKGYGTITITYDIPAGTQTEKHPHPGRTYYGIQRVAYLPDTKEGREVLQLLKRAFDQKLIFTVGTSRTTGAEGAVTWGDIHHKTSTHGGLISFGYPDPNYLSRVKDELKAKGIE